ncbi:SGNH/GDSL hydrolase family protein [Pseudarthrobacter sp. NPDC080039]|uniref:SGNH/GDSL hydrolase family protein n=1 Tax=unclassified Pseudarthrobacter TaxID=2647000 RepID=UPI0034504D57
MAKRYVWGGSPGITVSLGFHFRGDRIAVLGFSGLFFAFVTSVLAGCVPAADSSTARTSPRHDTSGPAPSQSPPVTRPERVVVIGDSLSTGYGTSPDESWPSQLSQERQQPGQQPMEVINAAQDGAGYLTAGDGGETFGSELAASVGSSTDVVVFFGSDNDGGQDPADLKAAVTSALSESKARAPHAVRILIGPLTAFEQNQADVDLILDQERAAAREAGAVFVDPIMEQWIASPDSPLLGPDGEHPSTQGQQFLKDKIKGILTSL